MLSEVFSFKIALLQFVVVQQRVYYANSSEKKHYTHAKFVRLIK